MPLRPEALPLAYDDLTDSQKDALGRIVGWMASAVDGLPGARGAGSVGDDRPRAGTNGVGLVSGERGTGKTSLMLTLKDICCRRASGGANGIPKHLEPNVEKIRARTVWLESLDMDTLPGPTNLLAAILARVRLSLTTLPGESDQGRSLLATNSASETARTNLEEMQTGIARAWRRQLPGSLDGDAYAVEVTEMEDRRLQVNGRLESVLEGLASSEHWPNGIKQPIFVLPVDDVDLSPFRCLELLQLLRMIAMPRLFALVLGDVRIAEAVMKIQLSGQYARLAKGASRESFVAIPPWEVAAIVGATASKVIRKVLPPSQRVNLGPMSIRQSLGYGSSPQVMDGTTRNGDSAPAGGRRTLLDVLRGIHLPELKASFDRRDWNLAPAAKATDPAPGPSLADFVIGTGAAVDVAAFPYWAAQVLQAPARQVADLWLVLEPLTREAPPDADQPLEALLETLIELLRGLIEEEPRLSPVQRERVLAGLKKDAAGKPVFQTDVLGIRREFQPGTTVDTERCTLRVHQAVRWSMGLPTDDSTQGPAKPAAYIEDRTSAAVMLIHDLVAVGKKGTLLGGSVASTAKSRGWLMAEWSLGATTALVPWPEPDWATFRTFDRFASWWQRASQVVQTAHATTDHLAAMFAFAFLSCALDVADREARPSVPLMTPPTDKQWAGLAERLRRHLEVRKAGDEIGQTLPVTLACALAPESAPFLTERQLRKVVEVLRRYWSNASCARAIRAARLARIKRFYAPGIPGAPLANLLVSPYTFERKVQAEFGKAARRLAQMKEDAGHKSSRRVFSLEIEGGEWGRVVQKLLEEIDDFRWETRALRSRDPAGASIAETDMVRTIAFLREAAEGLDRTLLMSGTHPINTECNRALCPWQADLDRLETSEGPRS
jgi:hypothetical protein